MIKIGAQQPFFLPDFRFFLKVNYADLFVIADFLKFRKQSPIVRASLQLDQEHRYLTVPVMHEKGNPQPPINKVRLLDEKTWRRRHLDTIKSHFSKYPYFEFYYPSLEALYLSPNQTLVPFLIDIIQWHIKQLFPEKRVIIASQEGIHDIYSFLARLAKFGEFQFIIYPSERNYYRKQFSDIPQKEISGQSKQNFPSAYHQDLPLFILLLLQGPDTIFYFPNHPL